MNSWAWAARAASLVAAVYPPLVWIAGYALSEALFWPIGLGCALLYDGLAGSAKSRASAALASGVLAGLGVLVRPALLLFVVLALLALARRGRWRACAAFIAGMRLAGSGFG
jgi:4-amino-4-deoxy-L-arabinose transferase-like glycosyltransferase